MSRKIKLAAIVLVTVLFYATSIWAWTENKEWQNGDSIDWDVPYQSQSSLRNWTTACMPTSGAMVVNFFYSGAPLTEFTDINNNEHPWTPMQVNNPYETTGQRIYAQGIISGNNADITLDDYLKHYPKNGLNPAKNLNQFYCTNNNGCTNARYGPLGNESFIQYPGTHSSFTNTSAGTPGYISSLKDYLSKKHTIEMIALGNSPSIASLRNQVYHGPVIISVKTSCAGGHIIVLKGVTSEGDFIVNDPWNGSLCHHPGDEGDDAIYTVSGKNLLAYSDFHTVKYGYGVPVKSNFTRNNSPFSPKNVPVEAVPAFNYDASGAYNNNYNGDGAYAHIRNGFKYWKADNGEWRYFYNRGKTLGFPYTKTIDAIEETAAARWTPSFTETGRYRVLVGFYVDSDNNSSEITYKVYHRNGTETNQLDQSSSANVYETRGNMVYKSLGVYCFDEGVAKEYGSVTMLNKSSVAGDINVDVVRFVYVDDNCSVSEDYEWNGNGSIISYHGRLLPDEAGVDWPYGITKDVVRLHRSNKKPVGFFQWQINSDGCNRLEIRTTANNKRADITVGYWNKRSKDRTFANVTFPFVIGPENIDLDMPNYSWWVVKVAFNEPLSQDEDLNAYCTDKTPTPVSYTTGGDTKTLDGGFKWNGNASVIAHMFRNMQDYVSDINEDDWPFGVFKDVLQVLSSSKIGGAVFR